MCNYQGAALSFAFCIVKVVIQGSKRVHVRMHVDTFTYFEYLKNLMSLCKDWYVH